MTRPTRTQDDYISDEMDRLRVELSSRRPASEVLDLAHDAFTEGFVAGLESSSPTLATEPSAAQCWGESMIRSVLTSPGAEYIYDFGPDAAVAEELRRTQNALDDARAEARRWEAAAAESIQAIEVIRAQCPDEVTAGKTWFQVASELAGRLNALRVATRELLATDGGDGLYDASRFSAAREECRRLVPRSE